MDKNNQSNNVNKFGNLNASQNAFKTTLNSQAVSAGKNISGLNNMSKQVKTANQNKKTTIKSLEQIENDNLYSIDKFYEDYSANIENTIFPILTKYDGQRVGNIIFALIISILLIAVSVYFLKLYPTSVKVGMYSAWGIAGAFAIWGFFHDGYVNKLKKEVIPAIMNNIPCVKYQEESQITEDEISKDFFLPFGEDFKTRFHKNISVDYRNVEMDISEIECYTRNKKNIEILFDGAVVKIKMKKKFNGITVVKLKKNITEKYLKNFKKANMAEIKFENEEFLNDFSVFSSNQKEAQYFVTDELIEIFKLIDEVFGSNDTSLIFNGGCVSLAIAKNHRWFNFTSLVTTILDEQAFDLVLRDTISLLTLIDYLKSVEILGL